MLDFEKAAKLEDYNERKAEIISRLNDYMDDDLHRLFCEAHSWDSSFDFVDCFEAEEIEHYIDTSDAYSFMCRIVFGNITSLGRYDMLRVNAYGNLESVTEYEIYHECKDNISDLADWLMDNWHRADGLYEEDEELFNAWEYGLDEDEEEGDE